MLRDMLSFLEQNTDFSLAIWGKLLSMLDDPQQKPCSNNDRDREEWRTSFGEIWPRVEARAKSNCVVTVTEYCYTEYYRNVGYSYTECPE